MGLVIAGYAAAVIVFAPLYLTDVMGAAQRIYWSFNVPLTQVLSPIALPAGAFLCVLAMLSRTGLPPLPAVFSAAACGFLISYLVQMKGYSYQAFPFVINSVLALAALLFLMVPQRRTLLFAASTVALVAVVASNLVHTRDWWMAGRKGSGHAAEMSQALVDTINAHAAGGGFLAISTHPSPGFPAAIGVEADWTSRTNSQWFLPAVAQLREGTRPADPATLSFAERQARAFILHDLAAEPEIVLVDAAKRRHAMGDSGFDFLDFYLEEPEFRVLWGSYREIENVGRFRVFIRMKDRGHERPLASA